MGLSLRQKWRGSEGGIVGGSDCRGWGYIDEEVIGGTGQSRQVQTGEDTLCIEGWTIQEVGTRECTWGYGG